jgi:hypothetical protein
VATEIDGDDVKAKLEAALKPGIMRKFFTRYNRAKLPPEKIAHNVLASMGALEPDCLANLPTRPCHGLLYPNSEFLGGKAFDFNCRVSRDKFQASLNSACRLALRNG